MSMILPSKRWGDIDFGIVLAAVGNEGFEGEEYKHRIWLRKIFGRLMDYGGDGQPDPDLVVTWVQKIFTMNPRLSPETFCMELDEQNLLPRDWFPDRIRMRVLKFLTLNAVGLSNMGLEAFLARGNWQKRRDPFFLAYMPMGDSPKALIEDVENMVNTLEPRIDEFEAPFGLVFNGTCPNVGHDLNMIADVMMTNLDICERLGIPIMVKGNALWPIEFIMMLEQHPAFSALCMGNSVEWARLRELGIDPRDWFRRPNFMLPYNPESPLAKYGGGGLGGRPLFEIHKRKCRELRQAGFKKPINFCGGIRNHWQAEEVLLSGDVQSVSAATMTMLRPLNVRWFVKRSNQLRGRI